jgi:UDP-glucose 4-epimerase
VQTVIVASTGAVYAPSDSPHHEDSSLGPTDIYGHTKLWTEQLASMWHDRTGIPVGIARLFNVFGPGETNPHLIPTLLMQAERGNEIRLGDLTTKRDYVYVEDVGEGLRRLVGATSEHGLFVCNLGRGEPVDGHDVVSTVQRLLGRSLHVTVDPARLRASDRPFLVSDCRRADEVLGWKAQTGLERGLAEAIRHPAAASVALA